MSNQVARNSRSKYLNLAQQEYTLAADITISDATKTQVIFDVPAANPDFDRYVQYSNVTGEWICSKDGTLEIDYTVVWAPTAVANGTLRSLLQLNAATEELAINSKAPVLNPFQTISSGSYKIKLQAGDFIGLNVFQSLSTPGNLNIIGSGTDANRYCRALVKFSLGS